MARSSAEALAAGAFRRRVRIVENEARGFEAGDKIDLHAGQMRLREIVDEDGDAVLLHHSVAFARRLLQTHHVFEAGAAAG